MSRNFSSPQYQPTPAGMSGPAAETATLAPAPKQGMFPGPMSSPKMTPMSGAPVAPQAPIQAAPQAPNPGLGFMRPGMRVR